MKMKIEIDLPDFFLGDTLFTFEYVIRHTAFKEMLTEAFYNSGPLTAKIRDLNGNTIGSVLIEREEENEQARTQ